MVILCGGLSSDTLDYCIPKMIRIMRPVIFTSLYCGGRMLNGLPSQGQEQLMVTAIKGADQNRLP